MYSRLDVHNCKSAIDASYSTEQPQPLIEYLQFILRTVAYMLHVVWNMQTTIRQDSNLLFYIY